MAGGGNSPVVAIKLTGSTHAETWSESELLNGDVVLQVIYHRILLFITVLPFVYLQSVDVGERS